MDSLSHIGFFLINPLGKWLAPTHRRWTWFYDVENEVIDHVTSEGVEYYHLSASRTRTRGERIFARLRLEPGAVAMRVPVLVSPIDSTLVRYLGFGPPLVSGPSQPSDFWEYLRSLGGNWMWDGVEDEGQDLQWLST